MLLHPFVADIVIRVMTSFLGTYVGDKANLGICTRLLWPMDVKI